MADIYRIFLAICSLCLTLAVFFANTKFAVINHFDTRLAKTPEIWSYLAYFGAAVLVSWFSIQFARLLSSDQIAQGSLISVEPANDTYLPSYLGYFFVALSSQDIWVFSLVFGLIYIFVLFSKAAHFNPIYFLFGFQYYYVVNDKNIKILIITRKDVKDAKGASFHDLKRINEFTFIDLGAK